MKLKAGRLRRHREVEGHFPRRDVLKTASNHSVKPRSGANAGASPPFNLTPNVAAHILWGFKRPEPNVGVQQQLHGFHFIPHAAKPRSVACRSHRHDLCDGTAKSGDPHGRARLTDFLNYAEAGRLQFQKLQSLARLSCTIVNDHGPTLRKFTNDPAPSHLFQSCPARLHRSRSRNAGPERARSVVIRRNPASSSNTSRTYR